VSSFYLQTEMLARQLASLRGVSPEEAVLDALKSELARSDCKQQVANLPSPSAPTVDDWMKRVRSLGKWEGKPGKSLQDDLYDAEGMPY